MAPLSPPEKLEIVARDVGGGGSPDAGSGSGHDNDGERRAPRGIQLDIRHHLPRSAKIMRMEAAVPHLSFHCTSKWFCNIYICRWL